MQLKKNFSEKFQTVKIRDYKNVATRLNNEIEILNYFYF